MSGGTSGESVLGMLEHGTATPLHDQISERVRSRIRSGQWPHHYKLHAESDLAAELGVSRGTVRRALRTLVGEGLLQQVQGRGTFVAAQRADQDFSDPLRSMAEVLDDQGIGYSTEVLAVSRAVPEPHIAGVLELQDGDEAWVIDRLRRGADGAPLMAMRNRLSRNRCPHFDASSLVRRSLFRMLEEDHGLRIVLGRRTITAVAATDELAGMLRVSTGSPLLHVQQITYVDHDAPLEFSDVWMPPARMRMSSVVRRQ